MRKPKPMVRVVGKLDIDRSKLEKLGLSSFGMQCAERFIRKVVSRQRRAVKNRTKYIRLNYRDVDNFLLIMEILKVI